MRLVRWLGAVCCFLLLSVPLFGCMCFSTPMCSTVDTHSGSDAVFVGKVVDVWPSRKALGTEIQHLSLPSLRRMILSRWHGALSAEEERDVRTSQNRAEIELRYGILQRVRFVVNEILTGPEVRELYTDASSCGYRFEPGRDYFVVTTHHGGRYETGACSRTSPVASESATEDLRALRARKTGKPLSPRVYGHISLDDLRGETRVQLQGDEENRSLLVKGDGRFAFDGLQMKTYRLEVRDERGTGERTIDLASIGCFEAFPWYSDGWRIGGSPVVIESRPAIQLPDPPELLPKPEGN